MLCDRRFRRIYKTILVAMMTKKVYEYLKSLLTPRQVWRVDAIIILGQMWKKGKKTVLVKDFSEEMRNKAGLPPLKTVEPPTSPVIYDFFKSLVKAGICKRECPEVIRSEAIRLTEIIEKLHNILLMDLDNIS